MQNNEKRNLPRPLGLVNIAPPSSQRVLALFLFQKNYNEFCSFCLTENLKSPGSMKQWRNLSHLLKIKILIQLQLHDFKHIPLSGKWEQIMSAIS